MAFAQLRHDESYSLEMAYSWQSKLLASSLKFRSDLNCGVAVNKRNAQQRSVDHSVQ